LSGSLPRCVLSDGCNLRPGRLILWQLVIGIMDRDVIAVDKVRREDHQIGTAGVAQRRKQDAAQAGRNDQVRELPGRRDFILDAGDLAPRTIPFLPGAIPDVRIEPLRKVGHIGKCDLVGGEGGWRTMLAPCLYSSSAV
jgi:hypothetical protein